MVSELLISKKQNMKRELKFRAWDPINKTIISPYSIHFNSNQTVNYCIDIYMKERRDLILMQFTGLKDRNGNEIYEGDIVKPYPDEHDLAQIIFMSGSFKIATKKRYGDFLIWNYLESEIEVVGNIYKNPELL